MGVVSKLDWFYNYAQFSSGKHYVLISFKKEKTLILRIWNINNYKRVLLFTLEYFDCFNVISMTNEVDSSCYTL